MNETGGIRVRRDAGDWVRTRVRTSALLVVVLLSGLLGVVVGIGLGDFVGWRLVALPITCLVAAVVLLARRYERGGFSRLLKGAAAERNVGGSIEYAITAPGCAVAHSVTEIARIGDIDHLVATPNCLWVVETKYRMVPRDRFAEVLRRIRVNLEAVRRWAPPGVEVRGCLVLATEKELPRKRLYEDGQVEVFDPKSLVRKLKEESTRQVGDGDVLTARRVWRLQVGSWFSVSWDVVLSRISLSITAVFLARAASAAQPDAMETVRATPTPRKRCEGVPPEPPDAELRHCA